mgnify:CR=1 FL=1
MTDIPCVECERLPVKSRRNTTCLTCGATVCERCKYGHFIDKHEEGDEEWCRKQGIIP